MGKTTTYPQNSNERGRLYHYLPIYGGPEEERHPATLLLLWSTQVGTFQEIVTRFNTSGYRFYNLELDDRFPSELRCAKPGYFVFGTRSATDRQGNKIELLGIFIPEGLEDKVATELSRTLGGAAVIVPRTIQELYAIPGARHREMLFRGPSGDLIDGGNDQLIDISEWGKRDIAALEQLLTDTEYREKYEGKYVAIMNGECTFSSIHLSTIPGMVRTTQCGNHGICALISKKEEKGYKLIKVGHLGVWYPENE